MTVVTSRKGETQDREGHRGPRFPVMFISHISKKFYKFPSNMIMSNANTSVFTIVSIY